MKARPRLAVFCSGYGSNFQAILDAVRLNRLQVEIAVMVCDKPGAYALKRAAKAEVPSICLAPSLFASKPDYERFVIQVLRRQKVGWIILAGFMRILSPVFIRAFRNRILNIHPSYLPAFKGAHAIRDAYQARAAYTGVTVHLVNEEVDAGKILSQEKVVIRPNESLESLEKRIHAVEHRLYPAVIGKICRAV